MHKTMRSAATLFLIAAASSALSAPVDEDAARAAAEAFVARDAVGSKGLRGCAV